MSEEAGKLYDALSEKYDGNLFFESMDDISLAINQLFVLLEKNFKIVQYDHDKKLISEFVKSVKETRTKIIEEMTKISETIGLKAEAYYPVNDNLEILENKWEKMAK